MAYLQLRGKPCCVATVACALDFLEKLVGSRHNGFPAPLSDMARHYLHVNVPD